MLVRFFSKIILSENFDLNRIFQDSGITPNMIPHIVDLKDSRSYDLIVAAPYLDPFIKRFRDFKLIISHDPLESAENDIRIHGS